MYRKLFQTSRLVPILCSAGLADAIPKTILGLVAITYQYTAIIAIIYCYVSFETPCTSEPISITFFEIET